MKKIKKILKAILPYGILYLYRKSKYQDFTDVQHRIETDILSRYFLKNKENGESYFEIAGAKIPDIRNYPDKFRAFIIVFAEVYIFPCYLNDNYNKSIVEVLDIYTNGGPYGYKDGDFDVSIKKGDVVIDAGSWIGDFAAYASTKEAITYAFEPVNSNYELLQKTAELNRNIYPVQKGLSNRTGKVSISIPKHDAASSIAWSHTYANSETISITTLDEFVKENKIPKVDFIKVDIEGEERNMLKGASWVLKNYAPKLAICTYHLPDDPQILEKIILEANPKYKIVHLTRKLFASVVT